MPKEPDIIIDTIHGHNYSLALGKTKRNRHTYKIADDNHTFAIEFDIDRVRWFNDGVMQHRYSY